MLSEVTAPLRAAVLRLAPRPGEERYSGLPRHTLPAAERDRHRIAVTILADGEPAGFFVLDDGPSIAREGAAGAGTVLLRAFLVDAAHQRRGIASAGLAALPGFMRAHLPRARSVTLTVNEENAVAIHVYRRAGFRDTGEPFLGGSLGPQRVLVLPLAGPA